MDKSHLSVPLSIVDVSFRENGDEHERTYFRERWQAELAAAWAAAVREEEVRSRPDASEIEVRHRVHENDSEWRVCWWKRVDGGYVCQKDYFTASHVKYEWDVVEP